MRNYPAGSFEQRISATAERVTHDVDSCPTYHSKRSEHFDCVERAYGDLMTLIGDAYRGGVSVERIGMALGWSDNPAEKVRLFLRRQGYVIPAAKGPTPAPKKPRPRQRPKRVVTAATEAPTKAAGVTLWNGGRI